MEKLDELNQLLSELETESESYSSFERKVLEVMAFQLSYLKVIAGALGRTGKKVT